MARSEKLFISIVDEVDLPKLSKGLIGSLSLLRFFSHHLGYLGIARGAYGGRFDDEGKGKRW